MVRGHIFCIVRLFYEGAVGDLDRSMHRSLWVMVAHSSFIEGSCMTKNTASGVLVPTTLKSYYFGQGLGTNPLSGCDKHSNLLHNALNYKSKKVYIVKVPKCQ